MEQLPEEIIRKLLNNKELRKYARELSKSNKHIIQDEDDILQYALKVLWERLNRNEEVRDLKGFVRKVMFNKCNQTDKRDRIREREKSKAGLFKLKWQIFRRRLY